MVSGHLQVKKGYYYVVLSYNDNNGKRRLKYFSTGLPEKGNKRKAEAELSRIRGEFEPPNEVGELAAEMLFADYLLQWLDIVKVRVKATTFGSYEQMVKSVIEPYFRKKAVTLQGVGGKTHSTILFRKVENRQGKFGYTLPRRYSSGAEICAKNRPRNAECSGKG